MRTRALALTVVGLALAFTGAASSSGRAGGDRVYALSDVSGVPSAKTLRIELESRRGVCAAARRGPAPKTVTLTAALASAHGLLGHARTVNRALGSGLLKRRGGGERVALQAVGRGKGGAALVGFLAEASAEPHNPLPLVNAAVVTSRLGDQQTALGLLDAAAKLPAPKRVPMGFGVPALIANARGVALFRLGRFAQAEHLFRMAVADERLLSEARGNLAASLLCQGKTAAAAKPFVESRRRDPSIGNAAAVDKNAPNLLPVAGKALDLSHGVDGKLPKLKIPQTSDAGAASATDLEAASRKAEQTKFDALQNESHLATQVNTALRGKTTSFVYFNGVSALFVDWQGERPDLAAAYEKVKADGQKLLDDYKSAWLGSVAAVEKECSGKPTHSQRVQCYQTDCAAAVAGAHASWLPDANAAQADVDAWASGFYQYASALAANLKSPVAGQVLTELARSLMYGAYDAYFVSAVANWTQSEADVARSDQCGPSNGDDEAETEPGDTPPAFSCPESLKGVQFGISVGVFAFSVDCESISVEGAPFASEISPFARVSYQFAEGSTSVFVGGKAEFPGDPHAGAYVTFDPEGNVVDCGVRGEVGAAPSAGPVTFGPTIGGSYEISMADSLLR